MLNKAPLEKDELVAVLKIYGKVYLKDYQHSPQLAMFVVDYSSWLIQTGYPAKELVFALFTSNTSPLLLEKLLISARLSVEESIEFFRVYGSLEAYFPFFYRSSATLALLTNLAQYVNTASIKNAEQLSIEKMTIVLSWLNPSAPHWSLLSQGDVERILQAAALTPSEQKQFLECYGQTYIARYQQLPLILEYIKQYVYAFTANSLDQPEARRFLAFLSQIYQSLPLDTYIRRRIQHWKMISDSPERMYYVFLCYARADEQSLDGLKTHLTALQRQMPIDVWHDRHISPGAEWKEEISMYLDIADIILLLISPDFMASEYCYSVEMKRAMERHKNKEACVIPVILRPVYWQEAPFGKLQALPTDAKPIMSRHWYSPDEAFYSVAKGIRAAVEELKVTTHVKKMSQ